MNRERLSSPHKVPAHRWLVWLAGMVVGNLSIGLLYWGAMHLVGWLVQATRPTGGGPGPLYFLAWSSFFLVPAMGGLVASYVWRRLELGVGATVIGALGLSLLGIAAAAVFMKEGVICLLIVLPLLFAMILAGALVGRVWFRVEPTVFRMSILPVLAALAIGEPFTRSEQTDVVVDEMLIQAPPSKVWPQVTAFPEIKSPPAFWLFRLGLPYPQATTTSGDFVGADRRCIFSGNAVFKEMVVELEPARKLAFDIVEIPHDPELMGHLSPKRGEFLLRDNGNGTTTLIGRTWYTLHVRPLWYFDWWTHYIFRAVHLRVMEDVRRRAEAS